VASTAAADRYAEAYGGAARAYLELLDPTLAPVVHRIVDLLDGEPNERLLDLATGTGAIAREAVARGLRVHGVDVAAGMIALAREVGPEEIEYGVADAASLPFDDATFDQATCGFGLSHMPDPGAVLREIRRVLRPDGVFVESSWGAQGANAAFAVVLDELGRASNGQLHAFAGILDEDTWAHVRSGADLIGGAGFAVDVLTERLEGRYESPDAAIAWALAWPDYGLVAERLTAEQRVAFERRVRERLAEVPLNWWFAINYYVAQRTG
jgi:SAM-dependent methyltransferase